MLVTIRLFARLRELVGGSELARELADGATASDAWTALVAEFPTLADYTPIVSCAVNEDYARLTATLKDGDEVAFLPPVSGGSGQSERAQRIWGVRPAFAAKRLRRGLAGARASRYAGGGGRGDAPR